MTQNGEVHYLSSVSTHSVSHASTSSSKAILTVLDNLIKEGEWGTKVMNYKVEASVLAPLRQRIRQETSDNIAKGHMKALKSLALNPQELREFTNLIVTGAYLSTTLSVLSLSDVTSSATFQRLGFKVHNRYSMTDILGVTSSGSFRQQKTYYVTGESEINALSKKLGVRASRYFGTSEARARKFISTHLDFLFDQSTGIVSCAILEIWLARLSPKHRPVEARCGLGNPENRTYLKGCTDYMIMTVVPEDPRGDTDKTANKALAKLNLERFNKTYAHFLQLMNRDLFEEYDWEALFIEAKSIEWFTSGKVKSCNLYQTIATCCLADRYGRSEHRTLKFCLSSGLHWIFGVVDNDTATAYVAEMIDNMRFDRTQDVISLLIIWMVLPGPMLKQEVFSSLTPAEVEERLLFPDESEDNPQSRQVFFSRGESEKVEVPEHGFKLVEEANIESARLMDCRDNQITSEPESEVKDEGDNAESRLGDGDAGPEGKGRGEEFRRNMANGHESDSDSEEQSNSDVEEPSDPAHDTSNDSENEGPSDSASEESSDEGDGSEYVDSGPPSSDSG